nr:MAG TPA: Replication associated protein [Microviridae sp.]
MCTSPLYRCSSWLKELDGCADFPRSLSKRFMNKKNPIIGRADYIDYTRRLGLPLNAFQEIPCGQCLDCRIAHSKEWAVRCMLESKYHDNNWFVTLTYDEYNLPRKEFICPENGLYMQIPYLVKSDVQKFLKRLRKRLYGSSKGELRYFLCGEYGDTTYRPHFHLILYGLSLKDLVLYKSSGFGAKMIFYYNSKLLSDIWGKGFVVVAAVNQQSCAYTARYALKKVDFMQSESYAKAKLSEYDPQLEGVDKLMSYLVCSGYIPKPFALMSRNPGIAREYFDENAGIIYKYDQIPGMPVKSLKYYDRLYDKLSDFTHRELEDIKVKRQERAEARREQSRIMLGMTREQYEDLLCQYSKSRFKRDKI